MENNIPNIFELATRKKLRFNSAVHTGLSVEQLWDLPLQTTRPTASDLDGIGRLLMKALREQTEDSLVTPTNNVVKAELQLQLDVVKAIIAVKQAENAAKTDAAAKEAEKARLKEILQTKQAAKLENLSEEEIEARLRALG